MSFFLICPDMHARKHVGTVAVLLPLPPISPFTSFNLYCSLPSSLSPPSFLFFLSFSLSLSPSPFLSLSLPLSLVCLQFTAANLPNSRTITTACCHHGYTLPSLSFPRSIWLLFAVASISLTPDCRVPNMCVSLCVFLSFYISHHLTDG